MPAIPVKERWWKSKAAPDLRGEWGLCFTSSHAPTTSWLRFKTYAEHQRHTQNRVVGIDPDVISQLNSCTACDQWDHAAVKQPLDLPLLPTAKRSQSFNHKSIAKLWISQAYTSHVTIMHRRMLDAIGPYLDHNFLIGQAYLIGGEQISDLVTILDRKSIMLRVRYAQNELNDANRSFMPCHECGRLLPYGSIGKRYLIQAELEDRSPRIVEGKLLLPPEIIDTLELRDRVRWPNMVVVPILAHDQLLDPIPSPYPGSWESFESFMIDRCGSMPFPRTCVPSYTNPGRWLNQRITEHGQEICLNFERAHNTPYLHWTHLFFLRFRACFEQRVAVRIDNWSDDQLYQYLVDYHEASWRTGTYFPI